MKTIFMLLLFLVSATIVSAQPNFTALQLNPAYPAQNSGVEFVYNQSLSSLIRKEPLKVVWGDQLKQSCNIPITEFDSVVKKKNSQLDILNVECH